MSTSLVVIGDALLDVDIDGVVQRLCPDAPVPVLSQSVERARAGGAGLAATLAAQDGAEVVLVTALAADTGGDRLRALLAQAGVTVVDLGLDGQTPEKVRLRTDGRSLLRWDRGDGPSRVGTTGQVELADLLAGAGAVLVADYGRGVTAHPPVRAALAGCRRPVVWDPHPRGAAPVPGVALVTPNAGEAALFDEPPAEELTGRTRTGRTRTAVVTAQAQRLWHRWQARAVVVTLGADGALMVAGEGTPSLVPAPHVVPVDVCGAGDRFASTAALALARGALPSEAVGEAVHSAAWFVAAGGAGGMAAAGGAGMITAAGGAGGMAAAGGAGGAVTAAGDADQVIAATRAAGGTVVATGGCFDLLHPGHVAVLQQARALGDCLIVCLNSDASVARLKGPGRPLQDETARTAVLMALGCVDAVHVFDGDTPTAALEQLRPDIWAKGGDYALTDLPEAAVLAQWGGQAVVLPYLAGRSTSALIREARTRA